MHSIRPSIHGGTAGTRTPTSHRLAARNRSSDQHELDAVRNDFQNAGERGFKAVPGQLRRRGAESPGAIINGLYHAASSDLVGHFGGADLAEGPDEPEKASWEFDSAPGDEKNHSFRGTAVRDIPDLPIESRGRLREQHAPLGPATNNMMRSIESNR